MKASAPQLVGTNFTSKAQISSKWNKALTMISEASPDGMRAVEDIEDTFDQVVNVTDLRRPGRYVVGAEDVKCVGFMKDFVATS